MLLGHTLLGSGPSLVVVMHEWLGEQQPRRAASLPGHHGAPLLLGRPPGLRPSMAQAGPTLDEACQDILALADALEAPRFHLIGHSMSALIAQRIAWLASDRVRSLVAITPVFAAGFPPMTRLGRSCWPWPPTTMPPAQPLLRARATATPARGWTSS
jgi:pimeloyl-ACP methyl ester carboxylesterase